MQMGKPRRRRVYCNDVEVYYNGRWRDVTDIPGAYRVELLPDGAFRMRGEQGIADEALVDFAKSDWRLR